MPKIPPVTSRNVIRILEKKGFVLVQITGSHHLYMNEQTGRQETVPIHTTDLPAGTFHEILKQAGISRDEFLDLI